MNPWNMNPFPVFYPPFRMIFPYIHSSGIFQPRLPEAHGPFQAIQDLWAEANLYFNEARRAVQGILW